MIDATTSTLEWTKHPVIKFPDHWRLLIRTLFFSILLLPGWSGRAHAQDNPRSEPTQPVHITADRFVFHQKSNTGDYQGHVLITQGKTHLEGQQLHIQTQPKGGIEKMILTGRPARFHGVDQQNKPVSGHANRITYYPATHKLVLTGNALILQKKNRFHAEHITYWEQSGEIDAAAPGKRVESVFTPESAPHNTHRKPTQ